MKKIKREEIDKYVEEEMKEEEEKREELLNRREIVRDRMKWEM